MASRSPRPHRPMLLGALYPLALRVGADGLSLDNLILLDALVTLPLAAGIYLAFRFFPPLESYLSTSALAVGFTLPRPVSPGDVLRVAAGPSGTGTALQLVQYGSACDSGSGVVTPLATTSTALTVGVLGWSCFLYSVPAARECCTRLSAISAVAATSTGLAYMPPPAVLPCQYVVAPASSTLPAGARVAYSHLLDTAQAAAALPGNWHDGAWQALKFGDWAYTDDGGNAAFLANGRVADLEAALYIAPAPGALLPVAARPHFQGVPGAAELAVVVTTTIPAGTQVTLTADPSPAAVPQWLWTAPLTQDVRRGTVILWSGLSLVPGSQSPASTVGTIQYVYGAEASDADLVEFTLYTRAACSSAPASTQRNISAVYTCARPAGCPLPKGLTAGREMSAAPWPAAPALLPLTSPCCSPPVPYSAWPCLQVTLCSLRPIAWACQDLPHFCTPACGAMTL